MASVARVERARGHVAGDEVRKAIWVESRDHRGLWLLLQMSSGDIAAF